MLNNPQQCLIDNVTPGQVRVFKVHIQRTPVTGTGSGLHRFLCPGQMGRYKGGGGGPPALAATREYKQSNQGR